MSYEQQASLFPQLPDPTREGVQTLLATMDPLLWSSLMIPWEDLRRYRETDENFRHRDEGEQAQWLRPQMARRARLLFNDHPDVRFVLVNRMPVRIYHEESAIVITKLTKRPDRRGRRRLTRSTYLTRTTMDFWDQRKLEGFPDYPRIIVGYVPQKEFTAIRIVVAHPRTRGSGMEWYSWMPDQSQTMVRPVEPSDLPRPGDQRGKGFDIVPKKDVKESENG